MAASKCRCACSRDYGRLEPCHWAASDIPQLAPAPGSRVFRSTQMTIAFSGGAMCSPTTSAALATNSGCAVRARRPTRPRSGPRSSARTPPAEISGGESHLYSRKQAYIRENGPLAVRAEIGINGNRMGYRATLCRCRASQNEPFCVLLPPENPPASTRRRSWRATGLCKFSLNNATGHFACEATSKFAPAPVAL